MPSATRRARRFLPTPPGPVRVSRRASGHRSSPRTAATSCSRPTKLVTAPEARPAHQVRVRRGQRKHRERPPRRLRRGSGRSARAPGRPSGSAMFGLCGPGVASGPAVGQPRGCPSNSGGVARAGTGGPTRSAVARWRACAAPRRGRRRSRPGASAEQPPEPRPTGCAGPRRARPARQVKHLVQQSHGEVAGRWGRDATHRRRHKIMRDGEGRGGTAASWLRTKRSGVRLPPGIPDRKAPPPGGAFAVSGAVPGAVCAPRRHCGSSTSESRQTHGVREFEEHREGSVPSFAVTCRPVSRSSAGTLASLRGRCWTTPSCARRGHSALRPG